MPLTNKGKKWEILNSLYLLLAPIPVLNAFCFVYMNARVKNKKWFVMIWVSLVVGIALSASTQLASTDLLTEHDLPQAPSLSDYISYEDKEAYLKTHTMTELKQFDEYKEYQKALDAFNNDTKIQKELEEAQHHNGEVNAIIRSIDSALAVYTLIMFYYIVSQRGEFLKKFAANGFSTGGVPPVRMQGNRQIEYVARPVEPRQAVQNAVNTQAQAVNAQAQAVNTRAQAVNNVGVPAGNVTSTVPKAPENKVQQKIDINTATEEQLSALPGLSIIDAKKAISIRDKNGAFETKDAFYSAIGIKPHILVKIDDLIYVDNTASIQKAEPDKPRARRQIDL